MEQIKVQKRINESTIIEAMFEDRNLKDSLKKASWLINLKNKCGKCGSETSLSARECKTTDGKQVTYVENFCTKCFHKQIAGEYVAGGLFMKNEWVAPFQGNKEIPQE